MYEVASVGNQVDAAVAIKQHARRPQVAMRNHMMRFLRRSKSISRSEPEKNTKNRQLSHVVYRNSDEPTKVQVARNGIVVAVVDGLPFVVGAKDKKVRYWNTKTCFV